MLPAHIRDAIFAYLPPLEGWCEPERACELAELIIDNKPLTVVELGTFGGRSAIAQAFALRENNNGGKIYCVDPWRVEYALEGEWKDNQDWYKNNIDINAIHQKCMEAIWQHNLDQWLVVIRAASQNCYELFRNINILFIDGNHSEVASLRDAQLYVPNVVSGGYVWADDVDWEVREGDRVIQSTRKMLQYIEESCDPVKQIDNLRLYRKR
jgi:predicted O-methyltransferase YrrM